MSTFPFVLDGGPVSARPPPGARPPWRDARDGAIRGPSAVLAVPRLGSPQTERTGRTTCPSAVLAPLRRLLADGPSQPLKAAH